MGVDSRKPLLPAPTDSSTLESNGGSVVGTDLATDLSRQTDKTSFSIPDDGSPITISTRKTRDKDGKISKSKHPSQTSLLIEYFEGGKGGGDVRSRPSVRVKVTPSAARKLKDQHDHIVVTESRGARRPSYSRRISLGKTSSPKQITEGVDDRSVSSLVSAEDSELARRPPVEIEVLNKDQGSDLSASSHTPEVRYIQPPSDISSMPPDSMLGEIAGAAAGAGAATAAATAAAPRRERSRSLSRDEIAEAKDRLKTPSRRRSRSLSRERIAAKVVEKLSSKPRDVSGGKRRSSDKASRSRSVSKELLEPDTKTPRKRSGKHREEEFISGAESSVLSNSLLSSRRREGDAVSFRSGTSKSSINNPKLLETVEDAIRRLILPELKELKKDQKVQSNRSKFERMTNPSDVSGSSASREDITRRVSKHSSAPDVGKPRVVLNRDSKDSGELLHSSSKRRKERRSKDRDLDSPSERSYSRTSRRESGDSTIVEDEKAQSRRDKSRRLRDAGAGALTGGILTAAALKHHDSKSSIEHKERRKKRSKSRSRSASLAESEEIFQKHDVPPMPMRSEIDSELTRDSILSERTDEGTPTHKQVREVVRGSPREVLSPASRTPTRTPVSLSKKLGTQHDNASTHDVSVHSRSNPSLHEEHYNENEQFDHHEDLKKAAAAGLAGGAGVLAADRYLNRHHQTPDYYEDNVFAGHPIRRGLSPIQSVASYQEEASEVNRDTMRHPHSAGSLSSMGKEHAKNERMSIDSLSSAPSTDLARSKRPEGIHLERPSEVLAPHRFSEGETTYESPRDSTVDQWYEDQHQENEQYRHSMDTDSTGPRIDVRHMTNYTDDSFDAPYLDKVAAGQEVALGRGANPEYVHTPVAVESAVASLHEPSIMDSPSTDSGSRSYSQSPRRRGVDSPRSFDGGARDITVSDHGSPLKQRHDASSFEGKAEQPRIGAASPPQSVAESLNERDAPQMGASGLPVVDDPMPEIGHNLGSGGSEESEITTNPSVIQGPIGGIPRENRDHWPYDPTPPRSQANVMSPGHTERHGLGATEAGLAGAAIGTGLAAAAGEQGKKEIPGDYGNQYSPTVNHDLGPIREPYVTGARSLTPAGQKDEGYISAANARSPGAGTPKFLRGDTMVPGIDLGSAAGDELDDPFSGTTHNRHLSGYSQGMPEPLYDSATGKGIDRIQSKDIVALMDHLTVRDAQRNARDTEILVTLVRSAAEMRNSFEDMKRFIAEQDDLILDTADRQHERTQRMINGPRPQPLGSPRVPVTRKNTDEAINDVNIKRKNVFRRALRGLGSKNTAELQNIEAMLVQLLGDVEVLRATQDGHPPNAPRGTSFNSNEHAQQADDGYEPEGQAGTSSTGDRSGFFSNNSSRQAGEARAMGGGRRNSEHRISTVMEGDEDQEPLEPHEQHVLDQQLSHESHLLTPSREIRDSRDEVRGGSVPLSTPPRVPVQTGALSNENTPRMSSDGKGRKHKSSSSSFFPKISRWSKTTASSVGDNFRQSFQPSRKERPYSEVSHSGSDLAGGRYADYEFYDPQGDDRLNLMDSLEDDGESIHSRGSQVKRTQQENRPPSPLIPSQVSDNPKYQAHRNSINLQHPTPRQAPTGRYQSHLESEAQNFGSPISPNSDQWGSNASLPPMSQQMGRISSGGNGGHLSPISDAGYSETSSRMQSSQQAPPRPPKIRETDDGPLMPARPPKVPIDDHDRAGSPAANGKPSFADHFAARNIANQPRKPSGPRPFTGSGSGQGSPADKVAATIKKNRYRGSPNHIDSSTEDLAY